MTIQELTRKKAIINFGKVYDHMNVPSLPFDLIAGDVSLKIEWPVYINNASLFAIRLIAQIGETKIVKEVNLLSNS